MSKKCPSILLRAILAALFLAGCGFGKTPALPTPGTVAIQPAEATPGPTAGLQRPTIPLQPPTLAPTSTPKPTPVPTEEQTIPVFASYSLEPVSVRPALKQEVTDPQMNNVLVPLALSAEQLQQLAGPGVVASAAEYAEFYELYKETTRNNLPVFVTSDALLHVYHLTFDQLLRSLEEKVFLPKLRELNQVLLVQAQVEYEAVKGTSWEDAARRVYAYLAVGSKLANSETRLPEVVEDLAQAELTLIETAGGPEPSPIFTHLKYGEDYSQYLPRGHYTKSDALKAYFKAMMWYGRMTFRLNDSEDPAAGPDETRAALLLVLAVRDGKAGPKSALDLWSFLYDPTAFLVGRSDDLTIVDYLHVMDAIYGPQAGPGDVADDTRLQTFIAAANELPAPRILGLLSDDYKPLEATKGLRFMGQRFVVDAYIFQELIHPNVPQRWLPSGMDVMAVMGSTRASTWLEQDPSTQSPKYAEQSQQLTGWMNGLSQDEWVETSYGGWLFALRPLLEPLGDGYPRFMQSSAWQDKQLNTALGSWAELKHDTLLYAKQAYGGIGACGWPAPPAPVLAQNYVEPVPEVFARIAALAKMTRQGLEARGLIQLIPQEEAGPGMDDRLDSLASKALQFKAIADKELQGQPLTEAENASLLSFGDYLEEIVYWANGDKPDIDPAAIIADVATDPNTGDVLEVGIGNIDEIYVIAPIPQKDGSLALTVARGGIFSYYEFPSQKRMTDEAWREKVKNGKTPDRPLYASSFSVPPLTSRDIQASIFRFQQDWANWMYWTVGYNGTQGCPVAPKFLLPVSNQVLKQAETAIADLKAQNQYEGRQLVKSDYLSVEQSKASPKNMIITVRETWSDYLVTYTGSDPFTWWDQGQPEPVTARRGPYSVDVRYELAPGGNNCDQITSGYACYRWRIVRYEEITERPGWETP